MERQFGDRYPSIRDDFLRHGADIRRVMALETPIHVFAVRDISKTPETEIITHRDAQPLEYLSAFADLLGRRVLQEDEAICSWMARRNPAF